MNPRRFRLRKLGMDEVSLVPAGDDPEAEVVLSKSDPDKTQSHDAGVHTLISTETYEENIVAEQIKKDDLPGEVVEYIESLEQTVDEQAEALAAALEDDGAVADALDEIDAEQAAIAKADPVVRELIEKAEQRAAEAEAVAKAERDERIRRDFVAKAQAEFGHLPGDAERVGEILKAVSEGLSEEDAAEVTRLLTAGNEAIAKSALFGEVGKSGTGTVGSTVTAAAEEIRKARPELTLEQAIAAAYESNPAFYEQEH